MLSIGTRLTDLDQSETYYERVDIRRGKFEIAGYEMAIVLCQSQAILHQIYSHESKYLPSNLPASNLPASKKPVREK